MTALQGPFNIQRPAYIVNRLPLDAAMLTPIVIESYTGGSDESTHLPHGEGTAKFLNHGAQYSGSWKTGMMEGRGCYKWDDGTVYEGTFSGNRMTGSGIYRWSDGSSYRGGVRDGLRNGNGVFTCTSREARYKGDWLNGKHHGYGVLVYEGSGNCYYEGEWVDGVKSGKGVMHYASGNLYDGEWLDNQKHGKGKMLWKDRDEVYVGDWENGVQSGTGVYTWRRKTTGKKSRYPFENRYEGQWQNGLRDGVGRFLYASGGVFQGNWRANRKNGPGVLITENGVRYLGEWSDDRPVNLFPELSSEQPYAFSLRDLIAAADDAGLKHALKDLNSTVVRYIGPLTDVYEKYTSVGPQKYPPDPCAALSRMQLWRFLDDFQLHKKGKTMMLLKVEMDCAYAVVFRKDEFFQHRFQDPHSTTEQFIFFDFLQYLIRIANLVFGDRDQMFPNEHVLASRLELLLKGDIIPNLDKLKTDPDNARDLLLNKVETTFADRIRTLYAKNSKTRIRSGDEEWIDSTLSMRQILWMFNDSGFLNHMKGCLSVSWLLSYFTERSPDAGDWNLEFELTPYEVEVVLFDCSLAATRGSSVMPDQVTISFPADVPQIPIISAPSTADLNPVIISEEDHSEVEVVVPSISVPTIVESEHSVAVAGAGKNSEITRVSSSSAGRRSSSGTKLSDKMKTKSNGPSIDVLAITVPPSTSLTASVVVEEPALGSDLGRSTQDSGLTFDPLQLVLATVENLDPQQLNVAVWSGDVVLKNLRLKREALDKFQIPIDVVEGHVGELTMQIPWSDLRGSPVKILLREVSVLAGPKAEADYDPAVEEERNQTTKQQRLKAMEAISAPSTLATDTPETQTFLTQLTTKIIDNLQFTFTDIHIRYEDRSTNVNHPFGFGVMLKELTAVSTDENGKVAFVQKAEIIHKLLNLKCLAIYFNTSLGAPGFEDTGREQLLGLAPEILRSKLRALIASPEIDTSNQYILRPVSGVGRMHIKKNQYKQDGNTNDVDLDFDDFTLVLDDEQYRNAFMLLGAFSAYSRSQKYRRFRPPHVHTPKTNPLEWLRYAGNSVLSDIQDRNTRWTWKHMEERRQDRLAYVKLWKEHQKELRSLVNRNPGAIPSGEQQLALAELERKLSFEDIRFYRSIAMLELNKEGKGM
ncbi:hypothetical protein HDU93_007410 [Gonapodya sp. JEL0774]|nr:hypothetical protein HDU93_007410 [Gonapodya sp. JEL0774]